MGSEMNKFDKKKRYINIIFIEYCFALVGPEFNQFEHPLLLQDSTPKSRSTNTKVRNGN